MTILEALILGVIQGVTEFLPISSSGHLIIVNQLLGVTEPNLTFDILLHLGSLIAILYFFRHRISKLKWPMIRLILIGSVPVVLFGYIANLWADTLFRSLNLVGVSLIVTAILLLLTQRLLNKRTNSTSKVNTKEALSVGLAQAISLLPGLSRSGATVSVGVLLGLNRKQAFEFSFFLAIPAIIGAVTLHIPELSNIPTSDHFAYITGFITSILAGIFSLKLFQIVLNKTQLHWFGYYCLSLGMIILAGSMAGYF